MMIDRAGQVERGHWITDGTAFQVTSAEGSATTWQRTALHPVPGISASSRLEVRLLEPLSSRTAKAGMDVHTVSIAPAISAGSILIPEGSSFDGKIVDAHAVGWGIRHETAALTVHFDSAKLPDGRVLPIDAGVFRVDNAREVVTEDGKIQGIRSTGTLGNSAENKISSLAQIDPPLTCSCLSPHRPLWDLPSRKFFTTLVRSSSIEFRHSRDHCPGIPAPV